ncbi:MAG: NAD(P)-binding domain-containing protein [Anaerolineae bacterium]|nr:NAD(P)-binding domain-containing protein [Anaerolineae bacterium]
MNITILGTGNIGGTLGKKWAAAGHEIIYGTRNPASEKIALLLAQTPRNVRALPIPEAIAAGEIILFATPWATVTEIAHANSPALTGKILIDATNRFFAEPPINNLSALGSAAPSAHYFRAFNSLGWEVFENPQYGDLQTDMVYSGPDNDSRRKVHALIYEIGVRPVWVGDNDRIGLVDNLGALWVTLIFRQGWDRDYMFKLVQREK